MKIVCVNPPQFVKKMLKAIKSVFCRDKTDKNEE